MPLKFELREEARGHPIGRVDLSVSVLDTPFPNALAVRFRLVRKDHGFTRELIDDP